MHLLLIFALTFTFSAQQEKWHEIMEKVMNAIGEEGQEVVINSFNEDDSEKLRECVETECEMADFKDLMEKMVHVFKGISHGDKLIYESTKASIKDGPLAELLRELSEEFMLQIINALNGKDIAKLMNTGKDQVNSFELRSIGKKIIPIIKKAKDGKEVSKLISMFIGDGDGDTTLSHHQPVPDGLHPGMSVCMRGTVPKDSKRFRVDFAWAQHDEANISLQFNPRFDEDRIVLRTLQAHKWGNQEYHKMPFRKGENFEIVFNVTEAGYQIMVNGKLSCTYKHRMPPQMAQVIRITGGLQLQFLNVTGAPVAGNLTLPYHQPVPGGLRPGMSVYMQGTVATHSNRTWVNFWVNFACGLQGGVHIPLHFRPYIKGGPVVLNTLEKKGWGKEEKHRHPFQKGERFEAIFMVSEDEYQILVNKRPLCTYRHRMAPQSVHVISVSGDLELQYLNVMGGAMMGKKTLPYHQPVPGGLHTGMHVYVQGTVPKHANRFLVAFASAQYDGADISLHFNARFDEDIIMLRTFQAHTWGNEESHKMPFQKGEQFKIIFIVTEAGFQILVNGKPFSTYKHRMPLQGVQVVRAEGDLELQSLAVMGGPMAENMALPYYQPVPSGLRPGMSVYMQGTVPEHSKRFRVDFAWAQHDEANISLQFNPRFDEDRIVLHTLQAHKWGNQEYHKMPFRKGENFEIVFNVTEAGYQIMVNGKLSCTYKHRMPPQMAQVIRITGGLQLQFLNVTGAPVAGNLTLPYHQPVPGGLRPGMSVYMQGTVATHSNRTWVNFWVNFACGLQGGVHIPLHFRPYIKGGPVVLNTLEKKGWGKEEKHRHPFQKGERFEAIFMVSEDEYQILVNKRPLCTYRHRMAPQSVHVISVSGDLELQYLNVMGGAMMGKKPLPYHQPVSDGLCPRMYIYVQGTVPKDTKRFLVNFASGRQEGANIPLQFKPLFDQGNLVLNTFQSRKWGKEEKLQNPFRKGEHFEIIFIVNEAEYQILVNGKTFCMYTHRIPPQSVQIISADGDLELHSLTVIGRPMMGKMTLPYHQPVPSGLRPGMSVYMQGTVPIDAKRFRVKFASGYHKKANISLHFNPWLDKKKIVLSVFQDGKWENKEYHKMPFQKGEHFVVIFIFTEAGYQILVNGKFFCIYEYKIPPQNLEVISASGDLELQYLNVLGGM